MLRIFFYLFVFFFASKAQAAGLPPLEWMGTEIKNPKGVVLISHGWNLLPTKMDALAQSFLQKKYTVVRMALPGHRLNDTELYLKIKDSDWREAAFTGMQNAHIYAKRQNIPFIFVGYSLGGLLGVLNEIEYPGWGPDKQILLAPGLFMRSYFSALSLTRFLPADWTYASRNHPGYAANPRTSFAAVEAAWNVFARLQNHPAWKGEPWKNPPPNFWQDLPWRLMPPTLVFVDPKDELIDSQGLIEFAGHTNNRWQIQTLDTRRCTLPKCIHHLIINEESLGLEEWQGMQKKIFSYLEQ